MMFKNRAIALIVVIAIIAGAAGWYAYDRHQSALAAEKARQEELAKKNAEAEAYNEAKAAEEAAKKAAEEEAAKEAAIKKEFTADEQGRGPLEQSLNAKEVDSLPADVEAQIAEQNKKLEPEYEAIKAVLTDYNKEQNEYDYRTFTGYEGEQYMTPEAAAVHAEKNAPGWKEDVTSRKRVRKFDGITIKLLVFTTDDFSEIVGNPENPAYAYAEVEVRAHDIEPAEQKVSKDMAAVWLKKLDGQWKIHSERPIE
jgi:hypothetical protein